MSLSLGLRLFLFGAPDASPLCDAMQSALPWKAWASLFVGLGGARAAAMAKGHAAARRNLSFAGAVVWLSLAALVLRHAPWSLTAPIMCVNAVRAAWLYVRNRGA